ncbi:MAG: helix-turn-helix domain-containing protein [Dehalococcoidia bacterium]|nr:helix-turn-helix domain-containing protein [Dehalococcoidia bacterium]
MTGQESPDQTFNPGVVGSNPTGPSTDSYLNSASGRRAGPLRCWLRCRQLRERLRGAQPPARGAAYRAPPGRTGAPTPHRRGRGRRCRPAWAILSARLKTLAKEGILHRTPYLEPGTRARAEYRLTDKGRELFPALLALMEWGDRWTADLEGPAVEITHNDCGQRVGLSMTCAADHARLSVRDIRATPGPGARRSA